MNLIGDLIFVYPHIPIALFLSFFAVLKYFGKMKTEKALALAVVAFGAMIVLMYVLVYLLAQNASPSPIL